MVYDISFRIRNIAVSMPADTDLIDILCYFRKAEIYRHIRSAAEHRSVGSDRKSNNPRINTVKQSLHMRFRERKIGGTLKQGFVKRKILVDFFLQCVSASGAAQYIPFVIVHRDCKNIVLYLCKGFRF